MHKQGQSKGQGRRQTERISKGRQGQKAGSKRSESYIQSGYKQGKHTQGKRSEMSDGAKQDFAMREVPPPPPHGGPGPYGADETRAH